MLCYFKYISMRFVKWMWVGILGVIGGMMIDAGITCYETMLNNWRKQDDFSLTASVKSSPGSNKKIRGSAQLPKRRKKREMTMPRRGLTQKSFSLLNSWWMQVLLLTWDLLLPWTPPIPVTDPQSSPIPLRVHKQQHYSSWSTSFLWNWRMSISHL